MNKGFREDSKVLKNINILKELFLSFLLIMYFFTLLLIPDLTPKNTHGFKTHQYSILDMLI